MVSVPNRYLRVEGGFDRKPRSNDFELRVGLRRNWLPNNVRNVSLPCYYPLAADWERNVMVLYFYKYIYAKVKATASGRI